MPANKPYMTSSEVSFGDMPLPSWVDLEGVVQQAANDMDAVIGLRYKLPLRLNPEDPNHRPILLMLNKINRYLVIGRVVIDAAIGHEDNSLQAYGNYHIRQAEAALKQIGDGKVEIPGAELLPSLIDDRRTGPMIFNKESRSLVDAFYEDDPFLRRAENGRGY